MSDPHTPDPFESGYEAGSRATWTRLLRVALGQLGYDEPLTRQHVWVVEREDAITILREACARFGDNDWTADLALADILGKHLLNYLEEEGGKL
jgi:hypothetical protein